MESTELQTLGWDYISRWEDCIIPHDAHGDTQALVELFNTILPFHTKAECITFLQQFYGAYFIGTALRNQIHLTISTSCPLNHPQHHSPPNLTVLATSAIKLPAKPDEQQLKTQIFTYLHDTTTAFPSKLTGAEKNGNIHKDKLTFWLRTLNQKTTGTKDQLATSLVEVLQAASRAQVVATPDQIT